MHYWNKESVASGLETISGCRRKLLLELTRLLNEFHCWEKSERYYDIIAGDWLEYFAHVTYAAMVEGLAIGGSKPLNSPIPVSSDLAAYSRMCWNESGLHEHLREAVAHLLAGGLPAGWKFSANSAQIMSGGTRSHTQRLLRSIATTRPEVLLVDPYFKCGRTEIAATLIKWRRWAVMDNLQYPIRLATTLDDKWRMSQASSVGSPNDLLGVLRVLLPLHLPVALLEGFSAYRDATLTMPVKRPKIIYSANALHSQLNFKLLAAEWQDHGTRLLYHQHGGGYGIDRIHTPEEFESRVADRYFTWGWSSTGNPKVKPMSPGALKRPATNRKYVLLSCCEYPKVVYRLHFQPMPGTIQTMHQQTLDFLAGLPKHGNLLVRPYPHDFGWNFADMMRKAAPDAAFDSFGESIFDRFAQSRLVVHNSLGTGYLETLALNVPTVCFYDANAYAFRHNAQALMEGLESVGVLHRTGKAAAKFIVGLRDNPEGWWLKAEVQDARSKFIEQFANFSPDWKMLWEAEFRRVIDQESAIAG